MRRRMIGLSSVLTASMLVASVGCESLRPATRSHKEDKAEEADELEPKAIDGDATKVRGFDNEGKTSAGSPSFFKNSRLPGAMSSEGREIEQSLGVH
jgi:hypothetical protein